MAEPAAGPSGTAAALDGACALTPQTPTRPVWTAKGKQRAVEVGEDEEGSATDNNDDAGNYERERQRRILENQSMMAELGLLGLSNGFSMATLSQSLLSKSPGKRQKVKRPPRVDRDGYLIDLPLPGQMQRVAAVVIRTDRKTRRLIDDGLWQDRTDWAAGEERRWRVGWGDAAEEELDEDEVGDVGKRFRWRRWRGLEAELRDEMRKRGELEDFDSRPMVAEDEQGVVYSVSRLPSGCIDGLTTVAASRDVSPMSAAVRQAEDALPQHGARVPCNLLRDVLQAVRLPDQRGPLTCSYSYFEFDPEARWWLCPLCRKCCNCANCIRKRDLAHLLAPAGQGSGLRLSTIQSMLASTDCNAGTGNDGHVSVESVLNQLAQGSGALEAPFDRVRLVDATTDVPAPPISAEWQAWLDAQLGRDVTLKPKRGPKDKKARKVKGDGAGKMSAPPAKKAKKSNKPIMLRICAPASAAPGQPRASKEVDSDGDTIDDGFSADGGGDNDRRDPQPRSPTPPRRLPFPRVPAQPCTTNEFLATLVPTPPAEPLLSDMADADLAGFARQVVACGPPPMPDAPFHMGPLPELASMPHFQPYMNASLYMPVPSTPPQALQTLAPSPQALRPASAESTPARRPLPPQLHAGVAPQSRAPSRSPLHAYSSLAVFAQDHDTGLDPTPHAPAPWTWSGASKPAWGGDDSPDALELLGPAYSSGPSQPTAQPQPPPYSHSPPSHRHYIHHSHEPHAADAMAHSYFPDPSRDAQSSGYHHVSATTYHAPLAHSHDSYREPGGFQAASLHGYAAPPAAVASQVHNLDLLSLAAAEARNSPFEPAPPQASHADPVYDRASASLPAQKRPRELDTTGCAADWLWMDRR